MGTAGDSAVGYGNGEGGQGVFDIDIAGVGNGVGIIGRATVVAIAGIRRQADNAVCAIKLMVFNFDITAIVAGCPA